MGRRTDTRQNMVDSGVTLFGQRGYANVTLLDVAEHANAPRGSIYHHLPGGKDELAAEVAAAWRYRLERQAAQLAVRSADAQAFLRAIIDNARRAVVSSDYTDGCPMGGIMADIGAESDQAVRQAVGATFHGWIDAIQTGLVSKGFKPTQARHVATSVVAAVEGAVTVSRATRDATVFNDVRDMALTLLAAAQRRPAA